MANEMRHLSVPRCEPIRSLTGFRSVLNAPKCVPDTNSHIKQIVFTMFDNGAYDLFYTVCILASEGHALLCPGPPDESQSGNICLTHGNKTETPRWLILLITITSRGCACVHNMFPITQDFLFKNLTQNEFQLKLFLISDMRARYANAVSPDRLTDRGGYGWATGQTDRRTDAQSVDLANRCSWQCVRSVT